MIETTILDYLLENNIAAYMERPENPPETYVLVEKTGSTASDLIVTTTFAFQSYAPSLYEASCLNEQVKQLLNAADTLTEVSAAALNSDYNYTDSRTKQYRYQAVYDITHKQ